MQLKTKVANREVGANFSLQLSSRTQLAKIENQKVIAENQCEKHKKSSLGVIKKGKRYIILFNKFVFVNGPPPKYNNQTLFGRVHFQ